MKGSLLRVKGKHVTQEEAAYTRAKAEKGHRVFREAWWVAEMREAKGPGEDGPRLGLDFILVGVGNV